MFRILLPRALAWKTTTQKRLREFFLGLEGFAGEAREFVDLVLLDLYPDSTRELVEWEGQFGLSGQGSETTRRLELATAWLMQGDQDPDYIQSLIWAAGFSQVYLHEWWESGPPYVARDPRLYTEQPLVGEYQCEGSDQWECFAAGPAQPLAPHCDDSLANDPGYVVNLDLTRRAPPPVPDNPTRWPYFLYLAGETFPDPFEITTPELNRLKALLLKIAPTQQWLVFLTTLVDPITASGAGELGPLGGSGIADNDRGLVAFGGGELGPLEGSGTAEVDGTASGGGELGPLEGSGGGNVQDGNPFVLHDTGSALPNARVSTDSAEIAIDKTVAGLIAWFLKTASVGFSKLANLAGLSVPGRAAAGAPGVMEAITASAGRQVLRVNDAGNSLAWGFPVEVQENTVDQGDAHTLNIASSATIGANASVAAGVATVSLDWGGLDIEINGALDAGGNISIDFLDGNGIDANGNGSGGVQFDWDGATTFVPDGDKGHIVTSGSGATWLWDTTVSITGDQTIAPTGNLALSCGDELRANGPGGVAIEALASPSGSVGANDIVINAGGGIALSAAVASPPSSVPNGNIELSGLFDLLASFDSGINLSCGTHDATAADGGDFVVNASGGVGIVAGATPVTGVIGNDIRLIADADVGVFAASGVNISAGTSTGAGADASDVAINAVSGGIAMHAGATPVTGGLANRITLTADDQIVLNPAASTRIFSGGTERATFQTAGDVDWPNGLDFDVTGAATIDATGDITLTPGGGEVAIPSGSLTLGASPAATGDIRVSSGFILGAAAGIEIRPGAITDALTLASVSGASRGLLDIREGTPPSTPANGFVRISVRDLTPNVLMYTDDAGGAWPLNVHGFGNATPTTSITNSTSQLSALSNAKTVEADAWKAGTTWRFSGMLRYARGSTATAANLSIDIRVGGTSRANIGTVATSTTNGYVGTAWVEGYITIATLGAAGTAKATIRCLHTIPSTTLALAVDNTTATFVIDTTSSNTLDLTANFSAAVTNLSLNWQAGSLLRVKD